MKRQEKLDAGGKGVKGLMKMLLHDNDVFTVLLSI